MSYVILDSNGDIALAGDTIADVTASAKKHLPKHTTVYQTWDADRSPNPPGGEASAEEPTSALAMERSGLPWNPSRKLPKLRAKAVMPARGVGMIASAAE